MTVASSHILLEERPQILSISEALLVTMLGGTVGVGIGVLSTTVYTSTNGWTVSSPLSPGWFVNLTPTTTESWSTVSCRSPKNVIVLNRAAAPFARGRESMPLECEYRAVTGGRTMSVRACAMCLCRAGRGGTLLNVACSVFASVSPGIESDDVRRAAGERRPRSVGTLINRPPNLPLSSVARATIS